MMLEGKGGDGEGECSVPSASVCVVKTPDTTSVCRGRGRDRLHDRMLGLRVRNRGEGRKDTTQVKQSTHPRV